MRLVYLPCMLLLLFVALEVSCSGNKKKSSSSKSSGSSSKGSRGSSPAGRPQTSHSSSRSIPRASSSQNTRGSSGSQSSQKPSQSRPQGPSRSSQNSQRPQTTPDSRFMSNGCSFSMRRDLAVQQPLILSQAPTRTDFLYPADGSDKIRLQSGQKIILACPGRTNFLQDLPADRQVSVVEVECINDKYFSVNAKSFSIKTVSCNLPPQHEYRRTGMRCHGNAKHVEIGFDLITTFLPTIDVCWDDNTMTTHWTKFYMTPKIGVFQLTTRPRFWEGRNFYGTFDVSLPYSSSVELNTIATLVGSEEVAKKYIDVDNNFFISRGHLTARNDFVYGAAQSSTFWYINAAPQWHTFNDGNWHQLEFDVRNFATTRNSRFMVYTGTHGQMSLKNVNDEKVPAYLYADSEDRAFPIPKFFWKIIYDPLTKDGTAFVGLNDPWATRDDDDIRICNDISLDIPWLKWEPDNFVKGFSYACTVDDLKKSVPTVPNILVRNILA